MLETTTLHATCVAVADEGVLILGEPGAGKSDLALRLIDQPGRGIGTEFRTTQLVADDQVCISRDGLRLVASAPPAIRGKLEIRGLGIVSLPVRDLVSLCLAVRLTPDAGIARLPDLADDRLSILGVDLPLVRIDPRSASAPARIRAALDHLREA